MKGTMTFLLMLLCIPGVFGESLSVSYEITDQFHITDVMMTTVQPDEDSVNYHYIIEGYDMYDNKVSQLKIEVIPLEFTADPAWFEGDQQIAIPTESLMDAYGTIYMPYVDTLRYLLVKDLDGNIVAQQGLAEFISRKTNINLNTEIPKEQMSPWLITSILILVTIAAIMGILRFKSR